jgi:uncharacterized membrane protein YhaH (DUF805 family)
MKNYFKAFKNIFNFKDRATPNEFWSFFIINILVTILVSIIFEKLSLNEYVFTTYRIITIFTLISLGFRRLKSVGLSGWLFLIPIANLILASLPEKKDEIIES